MAEPQPAAWSVLRTTIPSLFGLEAEVLESILCAVDEYPASALNLRDEEWAKLGHAAICKDDTFYVLLALSIGYLLDLRVSRRTFDGMVDAFKMLCDRFGASTASLEGLESSEILADAEIAKIGGFRIDSFDVQRELADELGQRGLILWKDLANNTEKGILDSSGLTWDSVKLIHLLWNAKAYAGLISTRVSKWGSHGSFVNMVSAFVGSGARSERDNTVMLGRLGLLDGRRWTLDELGRRVGLTRERIRQIEAALLKRLRHRSRAAQLELFRWALGETLRTAGGVCFPEELESGVTEKLRWERQSNDRAFTSFTELFGKFKVVKESGLVYVYDPSHKCVHCDTVACALDNVFADSKRERSVSEVAGSLLSCCANTQECGRDAQHLEFSEGFVTFVAEQTENVTVEDDTVYSRGTWSARYGTRAQLVESILRTAGQPMHFSEIYEKAVALRPDDEKISERNVYSWLGQSDNLLLWGNGTFVHCDHISVPSGLVREIETWLVEKLSVGLPFVYIMAPFDVFEKRCKEYKISSEKALYACMRRAGSSQLLYPRHPQVYLSHNFESRISPDVALERFILDEGAEVSYETLSEYSNELGLKGFQFSLYSSKLPNVVRTQRDGFVHIACLKFDFRKFNVLLAVVRDLLQKVDQVSIIKVFNDKPVSCADLGIDSPKMFFSLLRLVSDDEYDLSNYPIVRVAHNRSDRPRGMVTEVAEHIRCKQAPCSLDELETRFVEELGYSAGTVYAVTRVNGVLRFGRGAVVHVEALQWTDEKQSQLELQAHDALAQANASGRYYSLVTDLMEYVQLPVLGNRIPWTQTLLAELLTRGQRFRVLGSARNSFVRVPNDYAIETLEDLLYQMLKTSHGGAANLGSFEEYLRRAGIVQRKLTSQMLGNQQKVTIRDNLIMLTQWCGRA